MFIGNLSYKAKMPEIESFFNKKCGGRGSVISVRILSDKKTGKSKGFAFVEFKDEESFNKGLDCHHKILGNRRINVEMTVGGGGSTSSARKDKIIKKNEWLAKKRVAEGSIKSGPNSISIKPSRHLSNK